MDNLPEFKRILIKLSGEALMGNQGFGITPEMIHYVAEEIAKVARLNVEISVVVGGGANMFPKLFVDLYEASVSKDFETISKLREKVLLLYETIYQVGSSTSRFVKGTKCTLSAMGICNDYMAPPLQRFSPSKRKQIEEYIGLIT